jgi:hypothetical protein
MEYSHSKNDNLRLLYHLVYYKCGVSLFFGGIGVWTQGLALAK